MKFCFSFGMFDIKFAFYCTLVAVLDLYINLFIYKEDQNNIFDKHLLLDPLCYYVGFLLNIIPALISYKCSRTKKERMRVNKLKEENIQSIEYIYNNPYDQYLSTKDFIKFIIVCLFLLSTDFMEIIISISTKTEDNQPNDEGKIDLYEDDYLFFEFLIIFILVKYFKKTTYYNHQNISFLILCIMEGIKTVFFFSQSNSKNYMAIIFNIIISIIYGIYYSYIRGLMKYKFISPYKICYMIGMINVPIIIIYIVISLFDNLGKCNENYCLNISNLFKDDDINAIDYFRLISFALTYAVLMALYNKVINDYTLYHIYIFSLIDNFIKNIISYSGYDNSLIIIFLCISFFIELFMILVFLEIIEVNFWGLDKNLKKHIELRSLNETDSTFLDNDDDDNIDDNDDERMSIQKKTNIIN